MCRTFTFYIYILSPDVARQIADFWATLRRPAVRRTSIGHERSPIHACTNRAQRCLTSISRRNHPHTTPHSQTIVQSRSARYRSDERYLLSHSQTIVQSRSSRYRSDERYLLPHSQTIVQFRSARYRSDERYLLSHSQTIVQSRSARYRSDGRYLLSHSQTIVQFRSARYRSDERYLLSRSPHREAISVAHTVSRCMTLYLTTFSNSSRLAQ